MRLIDADALEYQLRKMKSFGDLSAKGAIRAVRDAPTVDAVETDLHTDGTLWIKIDNFKGVVAIKNVVLSCSRWCATFVHEDDAVKAVRCEDCKYKLVCSQSVTQTTRNAHSVTVGYKSVDFCSYGEREGK